MKIESIRENLAHWLRQGISPRRLALTLALGFAVGCIPVVGIPTVLCAGLAMALRLNLPAIQAANYIAMPLQLVLIVPFARLGGRIFASAPGTAGASTLWLHVPASIPFGSMHLASLMAGSATFMGHALAAWLLFAVPAVLLLFAPLTLALRRIPALAAAEAGD